MDRFHWAERHDGLISNEVVRASGETKRHIEHEREAGRLRKIRPGVSVVNGVPPTWRQAVRAVLLSCGDHVAASHWTAVPILGGPDTGCDFIHVITDLDRQVALEGVICHRSGLLEDGDIITRHEMKVTSVSTCWPPTSTVTPAARTTSCSTDGLRSRSRGA